MKSISQEQVAELMQLAQDRSDQARKLLVEHISDLFLSSEGRLTEHQRALMGDILVKLVGEFETVVRKEMAARFAGDEDVPAELVRLLANDRIEIARPILEKSGALRDEDLIEIVHSRSDEHRLCIAMRQKLSEEVSEALVESGGVDVVEALLRNQDAELSKRAMEYLVAESRRVDRFQEPLLSRHDLPAALAHRMFWWVSAALRKKIVTDFTEMDSATLDDVIQHAAQKAIADHDEAEGIMERARALIARLKAQGRLDMGFLIQALKQQKIPVFISGLAEMAEITPHVAWRVFSDKGGESLAVLCRAVDVNRNDFANLFLLMVEARGGRRVQSTNRLKDVLGLFDSITADSARAAMRYWQRDAMYQEALQGLKNDD